MTELEWVWFFERRAARADIPLAVDPLRRSDADHPPSPEPNAISLWATASRAST